MPQRKLTTIYGHFHNKTDLLLRHFLIAPPTPSGQFDGIAVEVLLGNSRGFLVNRLFHLWGEFCRHLIVASTLGGYRTLGGTTLGKAPRIQSISDILAALNISSLTGPRLRWGDPHWTATAIRQLQPANLHQITLGVGAAPYDEFRWVRNYVVHSNPHTRSYFDSVAINYSLMGVRVDDLLLHRLPGGGTMMERWVRDFQHAALDAVR